jgi:hypothetical protein
MTPPIAKRKINRISVGCSLVTFFSLRRHVVPLVLSSICDGKSRQGTIKNIALTGTHEIGPIERLTATGAVKNR